jgi:hypothetical protein
MQMDGWNVRQIHRYKPILGPRHCKYGRTTEEVPNYSIGQDISYVLVVYGFIQSLALNNGMIHEAGNERLLSASTYPITCNLSATGSKIGQINS